MCQTRELDLDTFFKYEKQPFPQSISSNGDFYETQKSNMVSLLEDSCDVEYSQPLTEEMLIDASVFIYSLTPQTGTFAEFSEMTFAGKIAQFSLNHH